MKKFLVLLVIFSLLLSTASFAYEVTDVKDGGAIKGKVKASVKVDDPMLQMTTDTDFCGTNQKALMYVLSPSLEVKNVLVVVEDIQRGKAIQKNDLTINNLKCRYEPLIGITYKGANFVIKNSDPIFHNTNLAIRHNATKRTVYNLALPKKDQVITKLVKSTGLHDVKCDAHPWMRAYAYVSEHPYVGITDEGGNFEIKDLPPGKYKVRFWHEGLDEITRDVEVASAKTFELSLTMSKK